MPDLSSSSPGCPASSTVASDKSPDSLLSSGEPASLEDRKLVLEIEELRRRKWLEAIKVIVAIVAALGFLAVFWLDRYSINEQRARERQLQSISRFDDLYQRTLK